MFKYIRNESGQTMVLVALMIFVLLGFGALAVDVGAMTYQRSSMQNAADAAALAAASNLDNAESNATAYVNKNGGAKTIQTNKNYNGDPKKVEVVLQKDVTHYFAKALGFSDDVMTVRAVATIDGFYSDAFGYAVFAGEGKVDMPAAKQIVGGDVYGRDGVIIGNKSNIYGNVVSSGNENSIDLQNVNFYNDGEAIFNHDVIPMPNFSALIKESGVEIENQEDFDNNIKGKNVNGPLYINGDLKINGTMKGNGIIYVDGSITFDKNLEDILESSSDSIVFYSTGDITFNGGYGPTIGIMYAPNGKITVNGVKADATIYGRVIAKEVEFNGSGVRIQASPNDLEGLEGLPSSIKLIE